MQQHKFNFIKIVIQNWIASLQLSFRYEDVMNWLLLLYNGSVFLRSSEEVVAVQELCKYLKVEGGPGSSTAAISTTVKRKQNEGGSLEPKKKQHRSSIGDAPRIFQTIKTAYVSSFV